MNYFSRYLHTCACKRLCREKNTGEWEKAEEEAKCKRAIHARERGEVAKGWGARASREQSRNTARGRGANEEKWGKQQGGERETNWLRENL